MNSMQGSDEVSLTIHLTFEAPAAAAGPRGRCRGEAAGEATGEATEEMAVVAWWMDLVVRATTPDPSPGRNTSSTRKKVLAAVRTRVKHKTTSAMITPGSLSSSGILRSLLTDGGRCRGNMKCGYSGLDSCPTTTDSREPSLQALAVLSTVLGVVWKIRRQSRSETSLQQPA